MLVSWVYGKYQKSGCRATEVASHFPAPIMDDKAEQMDGALYACRPLNRVLIAQRIAAPQMTISMIVAVLHIFINILFIHTLGLGFLGAAYAICLASLNNTLLTAAYVVIAGMQDRVWGRPTWDAFKVHSVYFACLQVPNCGSPAEASPFYVLMQQSPCMSVQWHHMQ